MSRIDLTLNPPSPINSDLQAIVYCFKLLMFRCTAVIGSLYSESVWGRAVFIKTPASEYKPVLGEPLM